QLEEQLCSQGQLKDLSDQRAILFDRAQELHKRRKEIPLIITPNSPVDHLLIYGVLDHTRDQLYETWDERETGSCIRHLQRKLLEDIEEHNNDEIEKIILFSGLHAMDYPYWAALDIQNQRELEKRKVQVYSTYSIQLPRNCNVERVQKERREICKELQRLGLPKEVVKIDIPAGPRLSEIMGLLK
ncbi:hypothetical protein KKA95_00170, partial [Patescibacteria group bacterium]|nr:hypothetical protein [Patescibacteria group bacterium]